MANNSTELFEVPTLPDRVLMTIEGVFGIVGNAGILVCQVRTQTLRNSLLAALAMADLIASAYFAAALARETAAWTVAQDWCAARDSGIIGSVGASTLLTLFVAVDRLAAIQWPLMYDSQAGRVCRVAGVVLACVLYPALLIGLALYHADPNRMVASCSAMTAMAGNVSYKVWADSGLAINILVVIVYGILQTVLRKKPAPAQSQHLEQEQMSRSIAVVVLLHIFTWLLTTLILGIVQSINVSRRIAYVIGQYAGVLTGLNNAYNGYIYVWRSKSYRESLLGMLGLKQGSVGTSDEPRRWAKTVRFRSRAGEA